MSVSYAVTKEKRSGGPSMLFPLGLFGAAVLIVYLSVAFGMRAPDLTRMFVGP